MARRFLQIVDPDHYRGGALAQRIVALGHHAELFTEPRAFVAFASLGDVLFADEGSMLGGVAEFRASLGQRGQAGAIIVTSAQPSIERAVRAIRAGAVDYLASPVARESLAPAVIDALAAADAQRLRWRARADAEARLALLSLREREVLALIAQALSSEGVGKQLGLSRRTVEVHRAHICAKLGDVGTVGAVRMFIEAGLADADPGWLAGTLSGPRSVPGGRPRVARARR